MADVVTFGETMALFAPRETGPLRYVADFRLKLEAAGFGIFIPTFFVASGIQYDGGALFQSASTVARVPLFLVALLLVRGLPAFVYRPAIGTRRTVVAALLQATSLPFIVAASMIGMELGLLTRATGAALIAAGLLSVLAFPLLALTILRAGERRPAGPSAAAPATDHAGLNPTT